MTQEAIDIQKNWAKDCKDRDKDKRPKATLRNLFHALTSCPELRGVFRFDVWKSTVILACAPPWAPDYRDFPRPLCDTDYFGLRVFLEGLKDFNLTFAKEVVADAIERVARLNPKDDVVDYLSALKWDGMPRLDNWLHAYLRAEKSTINAFMGSKWMIGAIARAYRPGCKMDFTLVLEGKQGIGKSTAFQTLFDPWFMEGMPDPDSPHAAFEIQGHWCVESSELSTISRADQRAMKSFLTKKKDVFRQPYGRNFVTVDRRCVFCATTNEQHYLRDASGARRYWCVACDAQNFDIAGLKRDRDQLFAEAKYRFEQGEEWHPKSENEVAMLREMQGEREEENIFAPKLSEWLERPTTEKAITLTQAMEALGLETKFTQKATEYRIADALKSLGYVSKRQRMPDGTRARVYVKEEIKEETKKEDDDDM